MISSEDFEAQCNLGKEYDASRLKEIKSILESEGARLLKTWSGQGGSQEIDQFLYLYENEKVLLETETYIGITLFSNSAVIKELTCKFK